MPDEIRLGSEVRDTTVFIYGNWSVGELKLSIDSLGDFISGSIYRTGLEEPKKCTSCKREVSPDKSNIVQLTREDMPICSDCRQKLEHIIQDILNEHSLLIVNESL